MRSKAYIAIAVLACILLGGHGVEAKGRLVEVTKEVKGKRHIKSSDGKVIWPFEGKAKK